MPKAKLNRPIVFYDNDQKIPFNSVIGFKVHLNFHKPFSFTFFPSCLDSTSSWEIIILANIFMLRSLISSRTPSKLWFTNMNIAT